MRPSLAILIVLALSCPVHAVVLYSKATRNKTAPTGSLANSGWQWEGRWGNFTGTVIGKKFFVTAEHIGGTVGQSFVLNGVNYKTTATYDDPNSDLQIWKVNRLFPSAAPLFKGNDEKGKGVVIFGRGTARSDPVVVNGQTKGWLWGKDDHVQSWGRNIIKGTSAGQSDSENGSLNINGQRIYWAFDSNGVSHEGAVSLGDSGGGVFTKVGEKWQLVGINFSTEGTFTIPGELTEKNGSIYDFGGLQIGDQIIPDQAQNIAARSYATRISTRISWINDVFAGKISPSVTASSSVVQGVPEPACLMGVLVLVWSLKRPGRRNKLLV